MDTVDNIIIDLEERFRVIKMNAYFKKTKKSKSLGRQTDYTKETDNLSYE